LFRENPGEERKNLVALGRGVKGQSLGAREQEGERLNYGEREILHYGETEEEERRRENNLKRDHRQARRAKGEKAQNLECFGDPRGEKYAERHMVLPPGLSSQKKGKERVTHTEESTGSEGEEPPNELTPSPVAKKSRGALAKQRLEWNRDGSGSMDGERERREGLGDEMGDSSASEGEPGAVYDTEGVKLLEYGRYSDSTASVRLEEDGDEDVLSCSESPGVLPLEWKSTSEQRGVRPVIEELKTSDMPVIPLRESGSSPVLQLCGRGDDDESMRGSVVRVQLSLESMPPPSYHSYAPERLPPLFGEGVATPQL